MKAGLTGINFPDPPPPLPLYIYMRAHAFDIFFDHSYKELANKESWPSSFKTLMAYSMYTMSGHVRTVYFPSCFHCFTVIQFKYIAIINESFYQVQSSASFPPGSCMVSPTHEFLDNGHEETLTPEGVISYPFDAQL